MDADALDMRAIALVRLDYRGQPAAHHDGLLELLYRGETGAGCKFRHTKGDEVPMSEPYSAMAQFQISPAALKSYLAAPARPASRWTDWAGMRGRKDATGQQEGLPFSLHGQMDFGTVDRWLSEGDYRHHLRAILEAAEVPSLARFDHDREGLLTIVNLTVATECFRNPLWFLAAIRGAADYADSPGGLAVIHNYIWGGDENRYTMAVLRLEPGGSRFLHPARDTDAYSDAVRRANAAFDSIGLGPDGPPPGDGEAIANLARV